MLEKKTQLECLYKV